MTEQTNNDESKAVDAVAERLKFFFSNANVRTDKFMRTKLLDPENKGGFIPIEALLKFNSIKKISTDTAVIAKAAKSIPEKLKLNDDETSICRVAPFTVDMINDNIPLTLCVSNLPTKKVGNELRYDCTMDDIRPLFEPYGEVALVKFQFKPTPSDENDNKDAGNKDADPKSAGKRWTYPSGKVYVEFETVEQAEKAAADVLSIKDGEDIEPKKVLTLGEGEDNKLAVMWLKEYIDQKKNKKRKSRGDGDKEENGEDEKDGGEKKKPEEYTIDWKPGCVIKIEGLGKDCDREAIRAVIDKHIDALEGVEDDAKESKKKGLYIDYSRGQPKGAIRFDEPSDEISKIAEKLSSGDYEIETGKKLDSAHVLEGDEEVTYWKEFIEFKRKYFKHREEERSSSRKKQKRIR